MLTNRLHRWIMYRLLDEMGIMQNDVELRTKSTNTG